MVSLLRGDITEKEYDNSLGILKLDIKEYHRKGLEDLFDSKGITKYRGYQITEALASYNRSVGSLTGYEKFIRRKLKPHEKK